MATHALELRNVQQRPARLARPVGAGAVAVPGRWAACAVVVAVGIVLLLGLDHLRWSMGQAVAARAAPGADGVAVRPRAPVVEVPVAPGDTLWSIALELRPGHDPRPLVDELARLNGGPVVSAGGSVLVPAELVGRDREEAGGG